MTKRKDYKAKVAMQLAALKLGASEYDNGDQEAAFRMSVPLRVLFKSIGRNSVSLLDYLSATNIVMRSTADQAKDGSAFFPGLVKLELKPDALIADWKPKYRVPYTHEEQFSYWWGQEVIWQDSSDAVHITRKDLVLMMAEKEGGAHVDKDSKPAWASLQRGGVGITVNPPHNLHGIVQNARFAAEAILRQIVYEVLSTPALGRLAW